MSDTYYTLQLDLAEGLSRQWCLTITKYTTNGLPTTKQLFFERLFDSHEAAANYGNAWASMQGAQVIHSAAITHLRSTFHWYGFDVTAFSNDQVSDALLEEATANTYSSVDLFRSAYARLRRASPR